MWHEGCGLRDPTGQSSDGRAGLEEESYRGALGTADPMATCSAECRQATPWHGGGTSVWFQTKTAKWGRGMWRKTAGFVIAIALLGLAPAQAARSQTARTAQAPTVMMVIDTSGSMAGARLTQAKEALTSAVGALSPGQPAGLRSYAGNCGDRGTLRVPIGGDNRDQLRNQIASLAAGGGTPTPDALLGGASDLAGVSGPRTIVLVSDGESTCGDPCPTAEAIKRDQGIDFKVHTVGFQTAAPASGELACIARVTGGQYFPVDDADGLADAINTVIGGGGNSKFVYLALGDSYQSGEGVGNSIPGTQDYLGRAYENGSNYPTQVGAQENTYTDGVNGGDSCHRAMSNYAKQPRPLRTWCRGRTYRPHL